MISEIVKLIIIFHLEGCLELLIVLKNHTSFVHEEFILIIPETIIVFMTNCICVHENLLFHINYM